MAELKWCVSRPQTKGGKIEQRDVVITVGKTSDGKVDRRVRFSIKANDYYRVGNYVRVSTPIGENKIYFQILNKPMTDALGFRKPPHGERRVLIIADRFGEATIKAFKERWVGSYELKHDPEYDLDYIDIRERR